jgi:Zn-dependent membrane protease YugP
MVRWTGGLQKLGSAVLLGSFLLGAITQAPGITLLFAGVGVATMASSVLVHLITLPVEFNASFQRALPILDQGGYLPPEDMPAARRILKACALTYVAASLAGLLNLWRWIRVFR